jgi:hypothetical protein
MKIGSMRRVCDVIVDPALPGRKLLSNFRTQCLEIKRARIPIFKRHTIAAEIIRFTDSHRLHAALCFLRDMRDRRFLNPYELLVFDDRESELQMRTIVATHEFILGIHPDDIPSCASRSHFGKVIESAESWQDRVMPAATWYVTTPHITAVDRVDLSAPFGGAEFERVVEGYMRQSLTLRLTT